MTVYLVILTTYLINLRRNKTISSVLIFCKYPRIYIRNILFGQMNKHKAPILTIFKIFKMSLVVFKNKLESHTRNNNNSEREGRYTRIFGTYARI